MKKNFSILLVIVLLLLHTLSYANDEVNNYNLDTLTDRLLNKSVEIKKIELEKKLLELRLENTLEPYEDLIEEIEKLEQKLNNAKRNRDEALKALVNAGDEITKQTAASIFSMSVQFYDSVKKSYDNLIDQKISMMKSFENMKYEKSQLDKKKKNKIEVLKYNLQKDYYNILIMKKELELLEGDIKNLNKQLDIEKLKAQLDSTTVVNYLSLQKQLEKLQLQKQKLENSLMLATDSLRTKLYFEPEDVVNINYELPKIPRGTDYDLENIITKFKTQNMSLNAAEFNKKVLEEVYKEIKRIYEDPEKIDEDENFVRVEVKDDEEDNSNKVELAKLELTEAELDYKMLEQNLELYVKQVYYNYKEALINLEDKLDSKNIIRLKGKEIESRYKTGMISELEYQIQKQELKRELFEIDKAIIQFVNAKSLIDLACKGIQLNDF